MDLLSERLKALGVKVGAQDLPKLQPRNNHAVEHVIAGQYYPTQFGDVFRSDNHYPQDYTYGQIGLSVSYPLDIMAEWGRANRVAACAPSDIVFLDTETTGLAGGTGTYAFLVGVGRHTPNGFELAQFFLRSPAEETALLAALTEFLDPCKAIVTFNGKAFDAPLLNARYTLQALQSPLHQLDHLDLLPLARRLWRDRLPSRTLGYLETSILGASRTQDEVPGWLIPQVYFDYLRTGDARPLYGVFYHNAMDIVALAALFNHTAGLLSDPFGYVDQPGLDVVALAKLYEDLGRLDTAIQLYERGLELGVPEEFFFKTIERYALLLKKQRQWQIAIDLWQRAASRGDINAYIEIAKYYEHEARDPAQALVWTESALDWLSSPSVPYYVRRLWLPDLERRLNRLKKKLDQS